MQAVSAILIANNIATHMLNCSLTKYLMVSKSTQKYKKFQIVIESIKENNEILFGS